MWSIREETASASLQWLSSLRGKEVIHDHRDDHKDLSLDFEFNFLLLLLIYLIPVRFLVIKVFSQVVAFFFVHFLENFLHFNFKDQMCSFVILIWERGKSHSNIVFQQSLLVLVVGEPLSVLKLYFNSSCFDLFSAIRDRDKLEAVAPLLSNRCLSNHFFERRVKEG